MEVGLGRMDITAVAGKRVVVMGLGRFGGQIAVARFLANEGARVLVTDMTPAEKLAGSMAQLSDVNVEYRLGEHVEGDFTSADLIVPSPAVPPNNVFLSAAARAGVPIRIEIELMLERLKCARIVGVTGTKGKSTTSAMLGRMLSAFHPTHVGGNIGKPLINNLDNIKPTDWVLLELSSYMLHYLGERGFRPNVALTTLISADHIDWHGGVDAYVEAKKNLVRHQRLGDHAVLYRNNPSTPAFQAVTRAETNLYDIDTFPPIPLLIPGQHNQLNAQGALLTATLMGVPREQAVAAVADFPGLPHRLELVAQRDGVKYYNDSIATIPEAAIAALNAFPAGKVLQIVGGYDKHLDMTPLTEALKARAKGVFCIGALGPSLADAVGAKAQNCQTLEVALAHARAAARTGDVILLSTGCASYDQFPNFESRGDLFRTLSNS